MEETLTQAIADYIDQRKQLKLEPFQKALNKVLDKSENESELAEARAIYVEAATPIEEKYKPEVWLTDAARRAKQISLSTHGPKYTHGDAKASSVLVSELNLDAEPYIITAKIKNRTNDFVGNSAVFDVAKLLNLSVNGENLITQLQDDHVVALEAFTTNLDLLDSWRQGFKLALGDEKLSSHALSKQIYFPIKGGKGSGEYHLLCPLYSSSLSHLLYHCVTEARFGDSKEMRDARKMGKYHEQLDQSFPATAIQSFGGSKPQNISLLNTERHGNHYLLTTAPPQWKSQTRPPSKNKTIFSRQFYYKVSNELREFKAFLEGLGDKERNFKVRYKRDQKFILPIIDALLDSAVIIQEMKSDVGWSNGDECQLKWSHCLWLDVYNPNELFQQEREKDDWLQVVASDFSQWLCARLKSDKYKLSDVEHQYFSKLCLHKLKRFERATPKHGEL